MTNLLNLVAKKVYRPVRRLKRAAVYSRYFARTFFKSSSFIIRYLVLTSF